MEVIVALVILSFGLLGMAGTTALVVRQISLASVSARQTVAMQTTVERLRALPFDRVTSGADSLDGVGIRWTVEAPGEEWKTIRIVAGASGPAAADTLHYRIIRP